MNIFYITIAVNRIKHFVMNHIHSILNESTEHQFAFLSVGEYGDPGSYTLRIYPENITPH